MRVKLLNRQFAYGMEGLLRQRHLEGRLSGILNGVDEKIWNPESESAAGVALHARYPGREGGKQTSATNCDGVEG
ncbi:glycogen synthase [Salmonella enterica subsp. enterica]|nr:glycogen synthase [Salmonella enterica subsp. enterica]